MKDFYQRVYEKIESAMTDALISLQEECGIEDGGCDPFIAHQYDKALEDMAEAVRVLLENQKGRNGK